MDSVDISSLTDEQLVDRAVRLAADERTATYDLVETLAAIDQRGVPGKKEYRSLFEFCVCKLKLSEAAAYRRIRAARALQRFPPVGPMLKDGSLTLETLALLHPFLGDADAETLVTRAAGMRIWEVERLVGGRRGAAPSREVIRRLAPPAPPQAVGQEPLLIEARPQEESSSQPAEPAAQAAAQPAAPAVQSAAQPTAGSAAPPEPASSSVARISFTADAEFLGLLQQARAALRHKYPSGRLDGVLKDALAALLKYKRPYAALPKPRMPKPIPSRDRSDLSRGNRWRRSRS